MMKLVLPMPPSANRYWRNWRGAMVVSEEARAYKSNVAKLAMAQRTRPLSGDIYVSIDVYRKQKSGDLDNRIKVVLDSLRGTAFDDDKQVVEIHARRFDDKSNPRVEVTIEEVSAADMAA